MLIGRLIETQTDLQTDGQTDRQNGYLVEQHRVNACLLDAPLQGDVSPFDREKSGCGHLLLHCADFIHRGQPVTHADREALALVPDRADFVGVAIKEGFRQIFGLIYRVVKVSSIYHRPKDNLEYQKCRQHFRALPSSRWCAVNCLCRDRARSG